MTNVDDILPSESFPVGAGNSLADEERPLLTCLLPVRNAAHDLPGFFASLRGYCDAVVALDDGSTDDTLAILEAEPLVKRIVRRPVREGYAAWNDATNRNRLLQAAADLNPRWILSLDADERLDDEDGRVLRDFLQTDAVPGIAYGFRWAQMRNDGSLFWPRYIWIYRLFHFEPGQRFPPQRLHFVPIPTSIPEFLRVKTTLRIQHLGELTAERRLVRFAKYLEADPARRFQDSYTSSIEIIDEQRFHRWLPRPPLLPVLLEEAETCLQHQPAAGQPAITVIILARKGSGDVRDTIDTITCTETVEILVVAEGWTDQQRSTLHHDFPAVTLIPLPPGVNRAAMRNAGLRQARGLVVLFLEAGVRIVSSDLDGWLAAHRRGYVMVAGRQKPANDSALAAADFCLQPQDGTSQQSAGQLPYPPVSCSYARFALHETGGFPEGMPDYDAEAINQELFRRGYLAWFDPDLQVTRPSAPASLIDFLRTSLARGRARARRRLRPFQQTGHLLSSSPTSIVRAAKRFRPSGDERSQSGSGGWQVKTLVVAGHVAAMVGATIEGVRAWIRGDLQLRQQRPQMILRVGFTAEGAMAQLVQCDYFQRRLTAMPVSSRLGLRVPSHRAVVTLDELRSRCRSLPEDTLRQALVEATGIDGLDYLIGEESDLNLILRVSGSQVQMVPIAGHHFAEATKVGRLVSSLQRKDIDLLQRQPGQPENQRDSH